MTTDIDNGAAQLVYTLVAAPTHGGLWRGGVLLADGDSFTQADIDAGALAYSHDGSETFGDGFAFEVDDGAGGRTPGRFAITITPSNDHAPRIVSDGGGATADLAVDENTRGITTVAATDADLPAAALHYRITGGADAALFTIDAASGALAFAAAPDFEAPADADRDNRYELIVEASDGERVTSQQLHVSVRGVNEAPASVDVLRSTLEDTPLAIGAADLGFSDVDAGDTLGAISIEAISGSGRFVLVDASGAAGETPLAAGQAIAAADIARLVYRPAADANGAALARLTLRVQDAGGLRAAVASTLTIDVAAVDDAPVLTSVRLLLQPGQPLALDGSQMVASDVDSANLHFTVSDVRFGRFETVANPGVAIDSFTQADVQAGRVRFVALAVNPAPSFRVTVSDGVQSSAPVAASIAFAASSSAPALVAGPVVDGLAEPIAAAAGRDAGAAAEPVAPTAALAGAAAIGDNAGRHSGALTPDQPRLGTSTEAQNAAVRPAEGSAAAAAARAIRPTEAAPVPGLVVELSAASDGTRDLLTTDDGSAASAASRGDGRGAAGSGDAVDAEQRDRDPPASMVTQAVRAASAVLTAGTVWWALRAGGLVASLLVVLPAWRHVDLLAVLPDDEEDDPWDRLGDATDDEATRDEDAVRRVFEPVREGEPA